MGFYERHREKTQPQPEIILEERKSQKHFFCVMYFFACCSLQYGRVVLDLTWLAIFPRNPANIAWFFISVDHRQKGAFSAHFAHFSACHCRSYDRTTMRQYNTTDICSKLIETLWKSHRSTPALQILQYFACCRCFASNNLFWWFFSTPNLCSSAVFAFCV